MPSHTRIMRMLAFTLLAQISQGLAPRAASTRRRWLAAVPAGLFLQSRPAASVTPGGEFCICNDKGCFGENCGGLKRPDVKYLGAATESYGQELSGASAALSGSRRGGGAPRLAVQPANAADAPESDLERAMREAAGKKSTEPRAHGR